MANPQKENGHVQLSNELLEALCSAKLNGSELSIILHVIRKTYGFNKKEDWISLTQFEKHTNRDRTTICKSIKLLVAKKLLVVKKLPGRTIYRLNKDYSLWVVGKTPLVVKMHIGSGKNAHLVVAKSPPTKDSITKDNIQNTTLLKKKKKAETVKRGYVLMLKWFRGMPDIRHPEALADKYASEHTDERIYKALKAGPSSRSKFSQLLEHYKNPTPIK